MAQSVCIAHLWYLYDKTYSMIVLNFNSRIIPQLPEKKINIWLVLFTRYKVGTRLLISMYINYISVIPESQMKKLFFCIFFYQQFSQRLYFFTG